MKRRALLAAVMLAGVSCAVPARDSVVVGAVYPAAGGQGPGGAEEYRGFRLAARLVNERGGVKGKRLRIVLAAADSPDAAKAAVKDVARRGARIVAGSYGSTISAPAAEEASRRGLLFWETGAVGELGMAASSSELVFRFAPTGQSLGGAAVSFVRDELLPRLGGPGTPRYTVTYVDDAYGRSVAGGALDEIKRSRLELAASVPYELRSADYDALARRIAEVRTDVLVVSSYLDDAVALRRALVRDGVPLIASIGTSSSYCMPEFGAILGPQATGLFASDKPDGDVVDAGRLSAQAAEVLERGRELYRAEHGEPMSAAALSGFAAGWALFRHVMERARDLSPLRVAQAARRTVLEKGALPNGSGLEFARSGTENLRATSVIWEWVRPGTRAVVWPPAFATEQLAVIPLNPAA